MTSFRQIEANRRNAQSSTGPKTEAGKQRSRGNAVRHGLTAETVIDVLEDPEDYKAFEMSVTSDYDAQTAVERELVLRLASLLWRLRRATAIETGLLQIQNEIVREATHEPQRMETIFISMMQCETGPQPSATIQGDDSTKIRSRPMAGPSQGALIQTEGSFPRSRVASYGLPMSTTAPLNASAATRPCFGAKRARYSLRSKYCSGKT